MAIHRRISIAAVLALAASVATTGAAFATTTPLPGGSGSAVVAPVTAGQLAAAVKPAATFQGALPAPTGRFAAGEDVIHLTDWDRPDPWVPSAGPRQLTVSMFYPAVAGTGTPAPYMTLAEAAGFIEYRTPAGSGITAQELSTVTTHAYDNAQAVHGKYPLVVLSPGFENPRNTLTSLATELASHGYVVALVGHTYEDSGETLANGQTPPCAICQDGPTAPDPDTITASRALDVSFVLDQLTHGDRAWHLSGLIDKHSIGMAGHSIGGAATVDTMIGDQRVRSAVNLDGTFFPVPAPGQITRPYLMMSHQVGDPTWTQAYANLGGYKRYLDVSGANHATFTDIPILAQEAGIPEPAGIDPVRGTVITREYVTAFFDQTLKGIHEPLLDGPTPNNPEVLFQY
ncbi:alpha/beta hydrolase family protein [Catenulispora pinisilvae]|uniref:alpha/beta hydrolase family protein n=1 Tax=Catenulispora pinisilvae TaxID=2705253 RepID=UPI001892091B|nr:alpha/beta hydrolase [Catenulispora pinisilvae]